MVGCGGAVGGDGYNRRIVERRVENFRLTADMTPQGDQPEAIKQLIQGLRDGIAAQVLLGVTGSGKTFTMAHVIATMNRPTLVIAPNKTLAAQLYHELQGLFPENAVRYFVSYYDYYQPEAYVPSSDTYIEKDSSINDEIDKMRHSATKALLERNDVHHRRQRVLYLRPRLAGARTSRHAAVPRMQCAEADRDLGAAGKLVDIHYQRNDVRLPSRHVPRPRRRRRGVSGVRRRARAIRIEFFGDTVESIAEIDPLRGQGAAPPGDKIAIYPASHYVTSDARPHGTWRFSEHPRRSLQRAYRDSYVSENKLLETSALGAAHALRPGNARPKWASVNGIENYSRHLDRTCPGRAARRRC